LWRFQSLVG